MTNTALEQIIRAYGHTPMHICAPQKGYRNQSFAFEDSSGTWRNLILYKREPGIEQRIARANMVARFVKKLPVRQPVHPHIIRIKAGPGYTRYGSLYNYLPGDTIPWEAYTMEHLKQLGAALGSLHAQLRTCPHYFPRVIDEYALHIDTMSTYFKQLGVQRAMQHKLGIQLMPAVLTAQAHTLATMSQTSNQHALHMDFVRGNILFQGAKDNLRISGILDFEKVAYGPPLLDIARTLAFLLVDCTHKTPQQIYKYVLYSGYQKRGKHLLPSLNHLQACITLFLTYDFYKFLRHNPYEALHANHHYVRTRNQLLRRAVLRTQA